MPKMIPTELVMSNLCPSFYPFFYPSSASTYTMCNYRDVVIGWLEYVANRDVATLYAATVDLPSCSALLFAYTWWRLYY